MYILYILIKDGGFDLEYLSELYTTLAQHSVESRQFYWAEYFDRYAFASPSKFHFQVIDSLHRIGAYLLTIFLLVDPTVQDAQAFAQRFNVPPTHVLTFVPDKSFIVANQTFGPSEPNENLAWDLIWDLVLEVQLTNTQLHGTDQPAYYNPYFAEEWIEEECEDEFCQDAIEPDLMAFFGPPRRQFYPMQGWTPRPFYGGRGGFQGPRGQRPGGQPANKTQPPPTAPKKNAAEVLEEKIKALGTKGLAQVRQDIKKELKENFVKGFDKTQRAGPRLAVAKDLAVAVVDAAFSNDVSMIKHGNNYIRYTVGGKSQAYATVTLVVPQPLKDESFYFVSMNKEDQPVYPHSDNGVHTMRCKNYILTEEESSGKRKKVTFVAGYTGKAYKLLETAIADNIHSFETGIAGVMRSHPEAPQLGWPAQSDISDDRCTVHSQRLERAAMPQYLTTVLPDYAPVADSRHGVAGFKELSISDPTNAIGPVYKIDAYSGQPILLHSGPHDEVPEDKSDAVEEPLVRTTY